MEENKAFRLEIISPERIFYEGMVNFVELTTSEGDIGVYKNHIPVTNVLMPGVVRMYEADGTKEAAVHSGFVVIMPDKVTIMAEIAEWPDEIDVGRAESAKMRAEKRLSEGGENINADRSELALKRALARLKITGR